MRQHNLFYGSSYDRGLDILLKMWPAIRGRYKDAELHICYGWDMFIKGYSNNPERMNWMQRMDEQMKQPGIHHYGRVGKAELKRIRNKCGIWAYPTYFPEINCITALECQGDGIVPVTMNFAALKESVQSGIKVEGDIYDQETQDTFVKELLALMGDKEQWKEESTRAKEFAKSINWDSVAKEWEKYFE